MWISDTRESYDTVAESYSEMLRDALADAPDQRGILRLFAELADGPVADVGCGTGRITHYLRGLGVDVSGIDLSPGMIAVAEREYPDCTFRVGSMTDLPFPDDSLGGLLAWWSLIHVPDDEIPGVFAQFRRVLRRGAR
ncbi:class I SAM-dependent methyltransferase [Actinoplanes sp. NPDC051343]|uniref:class I SAM-dependent methyltransferase n=1 Tax=Actinoplanes sp. NPDC051343 TaxID=3363906 RepID=UPI0037A65A9E